MRTINLYTHTLLIVSVMDGQVYHWKNAKLSVLITKFPTINVHRKIVRMSATIVIGVAIWEMKHVNQSREVKITLSSERKVRTFVIFTYLLLFLYVETT